MESSNSKIIAVCFALAGALSGFVLHLIIKAFSSAFGIVARFADSDLVRHGAPVLVAFVVFFVLQMNPAVKIWAEEVVTEVKKVVWPSRKDTTAMTIVVLIMVIISSVIISTFDFASGVFLKWIMGS